MNEYDTPTGSVGALSAFAKQRPVAAWLALVAMAMTACAPFVVLSIMLGDVGDKLEENTRAMYREERAQRQLVVALEKVPELDGAMSLPTANMATTQALTGIDYSEIDRKNESDEALSTTTIEALDSDLASAEQDEAYGQNIIIRNRDTSATICLGVTTWESTCSALTMTCRSGADTDGITVAAGERIQFRLLGTERPCLEATAAVAGYDVERYTLKGTEY